MIEAFALTAALVFLIALPSISGLPIYDDGQVVTERYQKWAEWRKVPPAFPSRWLTNATIALTFKLVAVPFQLQALHLGTALIHLLNAGLVAGIATQVQADPLAAMLVFAVSPLAWSAVAPIATRSVVFSTTFVLIAVWLTLAGLWPLALLAVIPATLAREDGLIAAPLIVLLTTLDTPPVALILAGSGLLVLVTFRERLLAAYRKLVLNNGDQAMATAGLQVSLPQPAYTLTAIAEYLWRWPLWNLGLKQNVDPLILPYRHRMFAGFLCANVVLAALIAWGPPVPLALILISAFTASMFLPLPDIVSESRAYPTVAGVALLAGMLPLSPLLLTLLVAGLAIQAARRSYIQRHPIPYWLSAWRVKTPKLRVAINIGAEYQTIGDMQNAKKWHDSTLAQWPQSGLALINMALWLEGAARFERQAVALPFIQTASRSTDALERQQHSEQYLRQAVAVADQALKECPKDKAVINWHAAIHRHAEKALIAEGAERPLQSRR